MTHHHEPSIVVSNLTLGYRRDRTVVHDLSARIYPGMTMLEGANGTGKSTVMLALAGQLEPLAGRACIMGHTAVSHKARMLRTVVTTKPALVASLTLSDHVELSRIASGLSRDKITARLEEYNLSPWLDTICGELSSGNQQRAWWALTTVVPRAVILVDEPFTAVDSDGVRQMVGDLNRWAQDGHTVLIVAHEPPSDLAVNATVMLTKEAAID